MAGAHLKSPERRPGRGLDRRAVFLLAAVLLLGLGVGAGATVAVDDRVDDESVAAVDGIDPPKSTSASSLGSGNAVATPDSGPVTIAFVGDINAEFSLGQRLVDDPSNFVGPFAEVLTGADLAVGNLEAALTDRDTGLDKDFTFRAPPGILDALRSGGVDIVSAANDHAIDFGPEGLAQTIELKAQSDGMVIGVGADEDEAYAPTIRTVGGQRIAVLAATQVIDSDRIAEWTATSDQAGVASAKRVDRMVAAVVAAREAADTVVVYVHWGNELEQCPSTAQQELATSLVDAGADIVVGTNAHRIQGAGRLGDAVVAYGLGNFLFGAVSDEDARSGALIVTVDGREVLGYEWRPGRIVDRVAQPLDGDDAAIAVLEWTGLRGCTGLAD